MSYVINLAEISKVGVCNPCESFPSLTILVPLWFIVMSLLFLILFLGFLQFNVDFVRG